MCLINYLQEPRNRDGFENFVEKKFGYGTWNAPYWFVGPEEGGGGNCVELATRIIAWCGLAGADPDYNGLLNLREYCDEIGETRFHGENARPQRTWNKLLGLLGHPGADNNAPQWYGHGLGNPDWRLSFQRDFLAQPGVEPHGRRVALLDISPLASPNADTWLWGCIASEPLRVLMHHYDFESRKRFLLARDENGKTRLHRRLRVIRDRLGMETSPRLVIFYGVFRDGALRDCADREMCAQFGLRGPTRRDGPGYALVEETHLFWVYHPVARSRLFNHEQIQVVMERNGATPWADH
jgi:hypothetical protein